MYPHWYVLDEYFSRERLQEDNFTKYDTIKAIYKLIIKCADNIAKVRRERELAKVGGDVTKLSPIARLHFEAYSLWDDAHNLAAEGKGIERRKGTKEKSGVKTKKRSPSKLNHSCSFLPLFFR